MTKPNDPPADTDGDKKGDGAAATETEFTGTDDTELVPSGRPVAKWGGRIDVGGEGAQTKTGGDKKSGGDGGSTTGGGGGTTSPANLLTAKEIEHFRDKSRFIVGLVGFPGAGKTFFLNRLKAKYTNKILRTQGGGGYLIKPPRERFPIGQTTYPTYHEFDRSYDLALPSKETEERDSFVIFDLPGEYLSTAVVDGMDVAKAPQIYDAMAACDAIVLVLPSDVVFGSELPALKIVNAQLRHAESERHALSAELDRQREQLAKARQDPTDALDRLSIEDALPALEKRVAYLDSLITSLGALRVDQGGLDRLREELEEDRGKLDDFIDLLTTLAARVALLRRLGITAEAFNAMTLDAQREEQRKTGVRSHTPLIYVALSKADAILATDAPVVPLKPACNDARAIESHPAQAVMRAAPDIFGHIASKFRWFKFDLLTTSEGQSDKRYGAAVEPSPANTRKPVQPGSPVTALELLYDQPDYGVQSLMDWLDFARRQSDEVRARRASKWRRWLGGIYSAPGLEADIAVLASLPEARQTDRFTRPLAGVVRAMMRRRRGANAIFTGLTVAAVLLGLYLSGIATAGLEAVRGGNGSYAFQPPSRLPTEVARLRQDPGFREARLAVAVAPWSNIPEAGAMFAVPRTRAVRKTYDALLSDLQQIGDRSLGTQEAAELIERLNGLQDEMNREYAAAAGARPDDAVRVRPFVPYHIGLVQLRAGKFSDAAAQFARAAELLDRARPDNRVEEGRLLGVRVATLYARGVALLRAGDASGAIADFERARTLAPAPGSAKRVLLSADGTAPYFRFDPARTPAQLHTAALASDELAARIRDFSPERDLAAESAISGLVDVVAARRDEIPDRHPLLANLVVAGSLLGKPIDQMRIGEARFGDDPAVQRTTSLAYQSLSQPVDPGQSPVAPAGLGIWGAASELRRAFADGAPDKVKAILAQWTPGDSVSQAESEFVHAVAAEAVAAQRAALPAGERGPLLATYGDQLRNVSFLARASDHGLGGHFSWGLLIAALVLLALWRLRTLFTRTWFAWTMQFNDGHFKERHPS